MRITRICLRDFAGVREREVVFAQTGITVVEGPNESGKSTLFQAFDLLLSTLDSSHAASVEAARPEGTAAGPFAEAEFLTGGYHVVYSKRWLVQPDTRATITDHQGQRQALTGRGAHDAVSQLLERTLDHDLWKALQVQQGTSLKLPSVGASSSLRQALDHAASGQLGGRAEDSLFDRVTHEWARYFTPRSHATGEFKQAKDAKDQAVNSLQEAREASDAAEASIARVIDREQRLNALNTQRSSAETDRREAQERKSGVDQARERARHLGEAADRADLVLQNQKLALQERVEQAKRLADAEQRLRHLEGEIKNLQDTQVSIGARRGKAAKQREMANVTFHETEASLRLAEADLQQVQRESIREALVERIERVQRAEARAAQIGHELEKIHVTDETLVEIEDLHTTVVRAEAKAAGEAARVVVRGECQLDLELNGEVIRIDADHPVQRRVSDSLDITLPGMLSVQVTGGGQSGRLGRKEADAHDALTVALDAVGVATVVEARSAHQQAATLIAQRKDMEQSLAEALAGTTLGLLQAQEKEVKAACDRHLKDRPTDRLLPTEEGQANEILGAAIEARDLARGELERHTETLDKLERDASHIAGQIAAGVARIQASLEECAGLRTALQTKRGEIADERLEEAVTSSERVRGKAREDQERALLELESLEPDLVEARLTNANQRLQRLEDETRDLENELHRDRGYLDALAVRGEGPAERLALADGQAERSQQALRAVEARAKAAALLYATLASKREAALAAYREPYREELERQGKIVFGRDFTVDLDSDLRVTRRTLDGLSLTVERLSSGALEQLGVIMRLACARLVSGEGVPVVLDDAFSYSDPDRLARLCLALDRVGEMGQAVLLTCDPDRYRALGGATIARVDRQHITRRVMASAVTERSWPQVEDGGPTPGAMAGQAADSPEERVLLALRESGGQMGKSVLLAVAQLSEDEWPGVIRNLLTSGRIKRVGEKRGAKYHLPVTS